MTTRHLLSLATGLLLSLAAVPGAIADPVDPSPCPFTGTYATLVATNPTGGCTIDLGGGARLTFSNFAFTPGGLNPPNAGEVGYTVDDDFHHVTDPDGEQLFGFDFNPALGGTFAVQDVLLQYTVVPTNVTITSAELLTNAVGGVGTVTENLMFCTAMDPNPLLGTCHNFAPIVVGNIPGLMLQQDVDFGAWTSVTVNKNIACVLCTDISLVRDAFDVTGAVPEPTTYGFVGIALLAIGYFSRRRTAR